jgi:hypothetical protein
LENLKRRDHLEELGLDGRIILKWMFREICCEGVDWMRMVQDRQKWRAVVNAVMEIRFTQKVGNFLSSCVTYLLKKDSVSGKFLEQLSDLPFQE